MQISPHNTIEEITFGLNTLSICLYKFYAISIISSCVDDSMIVNWEY